MSPADPTLIRSYRSVFSLERRIHRIDRWRLPTPYGVPLRGVAYAAGILAGLVLLGRVPLLGSIVDLLHPSLRYLALPLCGAWALMQSSVDGRSPTAAAAGALRLVAMPRRLVAFRRAESGGPVRLRDVTIAADERWGTYRRGVVEGPADVVVRAPATLEQRGATLRLSPRSGRALSRQKRVRLTDGQRLVVG